jgi:hypothetical protein
MGTAIIELFAIFFVFGTVALVFTWHVTKGLKHAWLRHLPRAVVAAIAYTPTIVPAPEFHGSLPMPAGLSILGIFSSDDQAHDFNGWMPLLVVALLYWSVATLISYLIKKYPAEE